MISWKYSFEKIGKDLELARKKKQTLDDLFNAGRISQSTYDAINKELTEAVTEIEARQKVLAEKMISKIAELEEQINSLEMFLANSEIQYAAGEIDEELHARESSAFALGLEAIKQELNNIKVIIANLTAGVVTPTPSPAPSEVLEAPPAEEAVEKTPEIPVEAPAKVEPVVEETKVEQPIEAQPEPETPLEESVTEEPSEIVVEEAPTEEPVSEVATEPVLEEAPIEEETEAPTEEAGPFRDEELEATAEEEEFEEEEE